jgi:hypothetical protein
MRPWQEFLTRRAIGDRMGFAMERGSRNDRTITTAITLAAMGFIPILGGCDSTGYHSAAEQAWNNDAELIRYEPAWQPNLEVYQAPGQRDFLVIYDEEKGNGTVVERRAYWLAENEKFIAAGLKPNYVVEPDLGMLRSIPVQTNHSDHVDVTNVVGLKAILLSDRLRFVLVSDGQSMGTFSLPIYSRDGNEVFWAARMSVAVAVDMVAFPVQMFGPIAYALGQSGLHFR